MMNCNKRPTLRYKATLRLPYIKIYKVPLYLERERDYPRKGILGRGSDLIGEAVVLPLNRREVDRVNQTRACL